MKKITCEMCGSTDFLKQEGVFVCQSCGCKYSVEEARKMVIEGTVDISGSTIKIDNTGSIPKYLEIAENALESKNYLEAENYSGQIVEMEPKNSRAWFIKGKAAGWQSDIINLRIEETVNCFGKAIDYAADEEIEKLKIDCGNEIEELSIALVALACQHWCKYMSKDNKDTIINSVNSVEKFAFLLLKRCDIKIESFRKDIANIITNCVVDSWKNIIYSKYKKNKYPSDYEFRDFINEGGMAIELMGLAIAVCDTDDKDDIARYKDLIVMDEAMRDSCSYCNGLVNRSLTDEAKKLRNDRILAWRKKIHELDNSYVIKEEKKEGCYIATAVYGSYDCSQVWVLRRFRDYTLAETWYGRAFVKFYYIVSPTVVKYFGKKQIFVSIFKLMLDRLVTRLRLAGVLDTPYEDKGW